MHARSLEPDAIFGALALVVAGISVCSCDCGGVCVPTLRVDVTLSTPSTGAVTATVGGVRHRCYGGGARRTCDVYAAVGAHTLEVSAAGHEPIRRPISVASTGSGPCACTTAPPESFTLVALAGDAGGLDAGGLDAAP